MPLFLNEIEIRLVASLAEKQMTTPEYYPLTLNALVQACNQKSSREPVVNYEETTVAKAIEILREKNLVYVFYGSTSRVPKYKHLIPEIFETSAEETALLTVLMLRGAQTPRELRDRTNRMHEFADVEAVETILNNLINRESNPLVIKLPRQTGQKDTRFMHLIGGEIDLEAYETAQPSAPKADRIIALEQKVEGLTNEVAELKSMFEEFKRQFE